MPVDPAKQFALLAAEECDLTVAKSRTITRRLEEEAHKAGYNLDRYLEAQKANEKLVPRSAPATRE